MANEHHRVQDEPIREMIAGPLLVSTNKKEVCVGEGAWPGRRMVSIVNDSSKIVYVMDNTTFTPGLGANSLSVYSGEFLELRVDPNPADGIPKKFWIATDEGTCTVKILEVK